MKRLGGGDGGLPSEITKRICFGSSINNDSVIEICPGGIPADIWKEILFFIYQPGNSSSLANVCRNWKLIRDALREEWPQAIRIQTLSSLFKIKKNENISENENSFIENYKKKESLSFNSVCAFNRKWLNENLSIKQNYNANAYIENVIRCIEELTGNNLKTIAFANTEGVIDHIDIDNPPMTGLEYLDKTDLAPVMRSLIGYLLQNHKYEIAFALTEVIFNTHALDFREFLIDYLLNNFSFEPTIQLIFALKCQRIFLYPLIIEGCLDLDIPLHGDINNLFKLKTHSFFKAIIKCFAKGKGKYVLPKNVIDVFITSLITPLVRMKVHGKKAIELKNVLLGKVFEIVPYEYSFERYWELISYYHTYFVDHELIPNTRYGPELWECKDLFIDALKKITHPGVAKSVLANILDDFYQLNPNMRDWWKTLREIEKIFDSEFNTREQFPPQTSATEELIYYLIKSHAFIEELEKPTRKLTRFPFALTMLLQQKPSLLNEFLFSKIGEDRLKFISLPNESSTSIISQNICLHKETSGLLLESQDEFSEDSVEGGFYLSKKEVFNIYICVINLLLKHKMEKVAESVISHIQPPSLRAELEGEFSLIQTSDCAQNTAVRLIFNP